jgi:hypothetical protein
METIKTNTKLLLLFIITMYTNITAQITFQEHVLSTNAIWARAVHAADIDGDGDIDVLSASQSDDKIAWYENTDGQGGFGSEQIISTNAVGAWSVYTADLDGDGDMDVLSASIYDDKIAWYENTDGEGSFGTPQIISTNAINARSVYASDLDGDGDMDVLSASYNDDKIAWYENTDGNGSFGAEQIITTNAAGAWSVHSADLDGDGDMDVLSASFDDDKVAWYENTDGQGNFSTELIITTNADGIKSVYTADLDGDGNMDVLSASQSDDKIAWYENVDGQGTFGVEQIITTSAEGAHSVFAADMDGDGDMDVLSASFFDNKIAGYNNTDGQGNFGAEQIISTNANGPYSVYATDLEGDGDIDVLSASHNDDKIAAYENLSTTLSVHQNNLVNFSVYPNPTASILSVESKTTIAQIDIYNKLGQLVLANSNQNKIDTSSLNQGFYFCKVKDENGSFGVKKIVKK